MEIDLHSSCTNPQHYSDMTNTAIVMNFVHAISKTNKTLGIEVLIPEFEKNEIQSVLSLLSYEFLEILQPVINTLTKKAFSFSTNVALIDCESEDVAFEPSLVISFYTYFPESYKNELEKLIVDSRLRDYKIGFDDTNDLFSSILESNVFTISVRIEESDIDNFFTDLIMYQPFEIMKSIYELKERLGIKRSQVSCK